MAYTSIMSTATVPDLLSSALLLAAATADDAAAMVQFLTDIASESDFVNVDAEKGKSVRRTD